MAYNNGIDGKALLDEISKVIDAAANQYHEAGEDAGEEYVKGVVDGIKKHSKEAKSEIAKMYEDFNKATNNFKSRKSITNEDWSRVLGLSKELLKSERYADSVRDKLNGISATFKNIGKVSGLDKIIAELDKAENKLETVTWAEAGKNYKKRTTTARKPKAEKPKVQVDPKPVVKAEEKKQEVINDSTKSIKNATAATEQYIKAQEKLGQIQLKRVKSTSGHVDKNGKPIKYTPDTYTALDGRYLIEKGTVGWNVYDNTGKTNELIASYETLKAVREDLFILSQQEAKVIESSSDKQVTALHEQEKVVKNVSKSQEDATQKIAKNLELVIKRYNDLMYYTLGEDHLTIGMRDSEDTDDYDISKMINEAEYQLSTHYEGGHGNAELRNEDPTQWKERVSAIKEFIKFAERAYKVQYQLERQAVGIEGLRPKYDSPEEEYSGRLNALADWREIAENVQEQVVNSSSQNLRKNVLSVLESVGTETAFAIGDSFVEAYINGFKGVRVKEIIGMISPIMNEAGEGTFMGAPITDMFKLLGSVDLNNFNMDELAEQAKSMPYMFKPLFEILQKISDARKEDIAATEQQTDTLREQETAIKEVDDAQKQFAKGQKSDYYEMSHKEATDYIFANYDKDLWDRWFLRGEDDARSEIAKKLESDAKLKNAALNQMWHNYKSQTESDISYDDFLNSKIPLYRGERAIDLFGNIGESITKDAASFSLDKRIAKDFAGALDSRIGAVLETYISPKDTLGMPRPKYDTESNAEAEVLIPMSRVADSPEYLKFKQKLKEKQDIHSSGETSEDVAKTIASYEELCGVVTRYNELVKKDIHRTTDEDFEFNDLLNRISSSTENVPLLKLRETINKDGGYDVDKLAGLIDFDKIIAQQKQKDAGQQLQEFIKLSKDVLPEEMSLDQQTVFANMLQKIQAEGMSAADAIQELSNALKTLNGQQDVLEKVSDASPNNKFREYDDAVAFGYDRIQKLQKIRNGGTTGTYSTSSLLRANHDVWDIVKNNKFFSDVPEDGAQRLDKIDEVVQSVATKMLQKANLTPNDLTHQLVNIMNAAGGNFRPNGNDIAWSHFATYDDSGNKHKIQKENGLTYKVYAAFENIEDLNADIVSSIMSELTKAGFEGRLKTTTGSAYLGNQTGWIPSTDQLVVHGSSRKDQEIAYNVLRNMKTPLSYLGGGFDSPDGSFTQTLASDNIEKYVRVQSDLVEQSKKIANDVSKNMPDDVIADFGAEKEHVAETVSQLQKLSSIDLTRIFDSVDLKNFLQAFNIDQSNFAAFRKLFEELMQITNAMANGVDVGNAFNSKMDEITNTIMRLGGNMIDLDDAGYATMMQDFYKHMSNTKVQFNDTIKADYTKDQWKSLYGTYKNRLTADLTKGIGADSLYHELSGLFPGLFPEGVLSQQDQFKLIFDKLDEARQLQANNWKTLQGFVSSDRDDIQIGVDNMYNQMSDALFADSSATQLNAEADAFKEVEQSATKAANAKGKFSKKNKELGDGAAESSDDLDDEAESLENVNRAAANLPDVSAYDSTTVRYDANGNPYNVSGTSRQEMIDGTHVRSTDNYQFDAENNRWDYMGTVQSSERTREMVQALEEYYRILNQIQKLRLDPSNAIHTEEINKLETEDLARAYQRVCDLGIQVNDIEGQINLSVSQRRALLDVELRARQEMYDVIAKMEDKQATAATKPFQKTVADEIKKAANIDTNVRLLGDDGASDRLQSQITDYRRLVDELVEMRLQLARNSDLTNDVDFSNRFADTAKRAQNARVAIEGVFKESQKLQKLGTPFKTGDKDVSNVQNLKSEMIEFANSALDGEVKINGFNKEGNLMYATLTKAGGAVENITVALNSATGHLQAFSAGTSKATNEWEDFKTQAIQGAKNLVGMYVGFQEGVQALRTGVNYVKEIDLAMTELKKVTDETDASYKQFLEDAGSTSAIIGSTIRDFTEASASFARLGYDLEQSSKLAETAIIYKNVADGLDTVEESSESIISTMMAFGIEANDTMSIIDRFNAVGKYIAQR